MVPELWKSRAHVDDETIGTETVQIPNRSGEHYNIAEGQVRLEDQLARLGHRHSRSKGLNNKCHRQALPGWPCFFSKRDRAVEEFVEFCLLLRHIFFEEPAQFHDRVRANQRTDGLE